MSQTKVTLSFNEDGGTYSLASSNTNVVQITSDGQSYTYKGKTYTPTLTTDGGTFLGYRLNWFSLPDGSSVGTSYPSSSIKVSPYTRSDYSSSTYNYYTNHSSTSYVYPSIKIDTSSGEVTSGTSARDDTQYCTYTKELVDTTKTVTYTKDVSVSINSTSTYGDVSGDTSFCTYEKEDFKTTYPSDTKQIYIEVDPSTGDISGTTGWENWCSPKVKSTPLYSKGIQQVYVSVNSSSGAVSGTSLPNYSYFCDFTLDNGETTIEGDSNVFSMEISSAGTITGANQLGYANPTRGETSHTGTDPKTASIFLSGNKITGDTSYISASVGTSSTTIYSAPQCDWATTYTETGGVLTLEFVSQSGVGQTSYAYYCEQFDLSKTIIRTKSVTIGKYTGKITSSIPTDMNGNALCSTVTSCITSKETAYYLTNVEANESVNDDGVWKYVTGTLVFSDVSASASYTHSYTYYTYYIEDPGWVGYNASGTYPYFVEEVSSSKSTPSARFKKADSTVYNYTFDTFKWYEPTCVVGGKTYTFEKSVKDTSTYKSASYSYDDTLIGYTYELEDPGWYSSVGEYTRTSIDSQTSIKSQATFNKPSKVVHDWQFTSFSWDTPVTYEGTTYYYSSGSSSGKYLNSATYEYYVTTGDKKWYLTSCTWDSSILITLTRYYYISGNITNVQVTSCSSKYSHSSSWVDPNVSVSFKWEAYTNKITWTTSGDSDIVSKIQGKFAHSFISLYNTKLLETNWNFDSDLSFRFKCKDGEIKTLSPLVSSSTYELVLEDDIIRYHDKFGKVTSINSINELTKLVN